MKLRVLGVGGGIGLKDSGTTSFLIGDNLLMDCGTGLCHLTLEEMAKIDNIILTHSHLDHIACMPLLIDSTFSLREKPIHVYAIAPTIEVLEKHIFNWLVWPDFTKIPSAKHPRLIFHEIEEGRPFTIDGCEITAIPAYHTVPAVGYRLNSGNASLVFTGDTTDHEGLWQALGAMDNLKHLIIELSFEDSEAWLAFTSKHYHTSLLTGALHSGELPEHVQIHITHLKPSRHAQLIKECREAMKPLSPHILATGSVIEF